MKKKVYYYLAITISNGVESIVGFRTQHVCKAQDVISNIQQWARLRFGIDIEVYAIFQVSFKTYKFVTTKIDWL